MNGHLQRTPISEMCSWLHFWSLCSFSRLFYRCSWYFRWEREAAEIPHPEQCWYVITNNSGLLYTSRADHNTRTSCTHLRPPDAVYGPPSTLAFLLISYISHRPETRVFSPSSSARRTTQFCYIHRMQQSTVENALAKTFLVLSINSIVYSSYMARPT